MNQQPDLFFEPWIGDGYARLAARDFADIGPGLTPMYLLGESHYGKECEYNPGFTRKVIRERALRPSPGPFFRNILATLLDRAPEPEDYPAAWDRLAFSNYVQDFLTGPREAPKEEMWDRAGRAFPAFLRQYRPPVLLVLGQRLWNRLDKSGGVPVAAMARDDVRVDDACVLRWVDGDISRGTVAMHILHPSAPAFDLRKARLRVGLLRELVRKRTHQAS
jgi:hypothetical protein